MFVLVTGKAPLFVIQLAGKTIHVQLANAQTKQRTIHTAPRPVDRVARRRRLLQMLREPSLN